MDWLNDWDCRTYVVINGSSVGDQIDYQIKLSINYISGMRSDFGDVRFTNNDGTSQLNYWMESYTSSSMAIFWIKVPLILSYPATTKIYMYWHNDLVTTTSAVSGVFIREISDVKCCWGFDENTGTVVYDKSGNSVSGTLVGAPLWVDGKYDASVLFDGIDDYMSWSYTKPSNNFSIVFMMKVTTTHQIDTQSTSAITGRTGQRYVVGSTNEGTNLGVGISAGTNGISVYGGNTNYMTPLAVCYGDIGTDWNNVIVTFTNKQPKIYLNGLLVHTGLTCTQTYIYAPIRLGGDSSYGYFPGYVDDFYIINSTLTQAQITDWVANRGYNTTSYPGKTLIRKYVYPEPDAILSTDTGNICSKSQNIFTCTVSGISVYDLLSETLINHISDTGVVSVWANDDYLFFGTTHSGIHKVDISTISGTCSKEIFKQYPDITSNRIRYIHGSGDYLCITTLSGVDRYNLITDDRKYTTITGATKCFQINNGDYYYSTGTNLHAEYSNGSSFIYSPDEGSVLQSYTTYDINNDCSINDMYITKETSSYYNGNTIFLATNHGVVVIEEKRGDEENARRRYYLLNDNFVIQTPVIIIINKGYFLGGLITIYVDMIERLNFITEVSAVLIATLADKAYAGTGVNSVTKGYMLGGTGNLGVVNTIRDLIFSTELVGVIVSTLNTAKYRGAGINSSTKGYILGGRTTVSVAVIEDLTFSTETSELIYAVLSTPNSYGTGVNSSTKGYYVGGGSTSASQIEDFVFRYEISSLITATLSNATNRYGAGVNSATKGYYMGGWYVNPTTIIESLIFSTETTNVITATLDIAKGSATGINSDIKGYSMGGSTGSFGGVPLHSEIEDLSFVTEVSLMMTTTLSEDKTLGTGVQSGSI